VAVQTEGLENSLAAQLESFRDKTLGLLRVRMAKKDWERDGFTPPTKQRLALSALRELILKAAATSACPEFWQTCSGSLSDYDGFPEINLEQLTVLMFSWMESAVSGKWDTGSSSHRSDVHSLRPQETAFKCAARQNTFESVLQELQTKVRATGTSQFAHASQLALEDNDIVIVEDADSLQEGTPVYLNIYDAFHEKSIRWVNALLAPESSEWRLGGAFHTGVSVNAMEWSYGFSSDGASGVAWNVPRDHHQHRFRQSILIGHTQLPTDLIMDVLTDLCDEYSGADYHMLQHNCCHFANDFCQRLAVGGIPDWLNRGALLFANAEGWVQGLTRGFSSCSSCSNVRSDESDNSNKEQWLYRL